MSVLFAKLVPTGSAGPCREIPLQVFPLRLGRTAKADVLIDDRWVSREHCEIDRQDDALVIRDLGSKHGTFVNGQTVTNAELHAGDELSLGLTRFVVYWEAADAADANEDILS